MKKLIDAIVKKTEKECPRTLALIGVYGSVLTGDTHEKSDIDLLILINDDNGWKLGKSFIDEELGIGQDLYCTNWEGLMYDAKYVHPYISKLMDSKIVYCSDEKYMRRLEDLRKEAKVILESSFGKEDLDRVKPMIKCAKEYMANMFLVEKLSEIRFNAARVIYELQNAVMMINKSYFKLGTKRTFEEIGALEKKPVDFVEIIDSITKATHEEEIGTLVVRLLKNTIAFMDSFRDVNDKEPVTKDNIVGSYEEMYSNWKNKMGVARDLEMPYLAFMSMSSLQEMLNDIASECAINKIDVFEYYDPKNLEKSKEGYDAILEEYLKEYKKAGIEVCSYKNMDEFFEDYLRE